MPDLLSETPLLVDLELTIRISNAERAIAGLAEEYPSLDGIARFLLRSEAVASSLIEGIAPSPQHIALAELARDEPIRGFSDLARLVANNISVVSRATSALGDVDEVRVSDIVELQSILLPTEHHHGLRRVQNWIGGSNWHPLDAAYVPPAPDEVPRLMDDLVAYLSSSAHAPLVQAALLHAQFEAIHPFVDGNGRVGRALIHTALVRRRLTKGSILPISLVLTTLRDDYVAGLQAYVHDGAAGSPRSHDATNQWLRVFVHATERALGDTQRLAGDIAALRERWRTQLAELRTGRGLRPAPKSGSATAMLLGRLPDLPLATTRTVQRLFGLTFPSARAALEELADAEILTRRSVERSTTGYLTKDLLDLVTFAERRLASTQFDTRLAAPTRAVPALPTRQSVPDSPR